MVPVGFDVLAEQLLPVVMIRLALCNRGIGQGHQAGNHYDGCEKTLYTFHAHDSSPVVSLW
jgi:hypothetical protein